MPSKVDFETRVILKRGIHRSCGIDSGNIELLYKVHGPIFFQIKFDTLPEE